MSQRELGQAAGYSEDQMSSIERGDGHRSWAFL
ncbi:hypothetical protein ACFVDU_00290 [Streptomyces albidoflavus]